MNDIDNYKKLEAQMCTDLPNEIAKQGQIANQAKIHHKNGADMMGTGAIGQSFGGESNLSNLEGLREELKMLDAKERDFDEFDQVQFGAEFAEISKLARNIDDVSIDSARVDLKELGGDELNANLNMNNLMKDEDDMQRKVQSDALKQKRSSGVRKAAGTGDVENNHRLNSQQNKSNEKDKNVKNQQSVTSLKDAARDIEESESCYINQSEIQSNPSQSQSQSMVTTERSHFTSIEGPPKIYEEIMRQLEADIRKHIRIEHQLKLHIESVEDRVEELEREQEDNEKTQTEIGELKKQVETLKSDLKTSEQIIAEQQASSEKQNELIEQLESQKKEFDSEKDTLLMEIKKLKEENANLSKDLKVTRSQNQRDNETIKKLQNEIQADIVQKKNLANFDPYQAILDDSNKKYQNLNAFEFGPGSGLSGTSGVSAVSNNSALSSNNHQLTRSQKNQHQFSQLNQQNQISYDRLSMSENRAQVSQQINKIPVENYGDGTVSKIEEDQRVMTEQQELPYKSQGENYLAQQSNQITLMNQMINTASSKNLSSMSEQNTVLKKSLAAGDSNTQSKLSVKQMNVHSSKQISQSIRNSSKDKPNQNSKYASCSPGIVKPTFVMNQQPLSQPNGITSTSSKSNRIRPKKIQKHQSLEKFNNAALYGTQVVGAVNQSLIVGGNANAAGSVGMTNQQQIKTAGAFPCGPEVQIKVQNIGAGGGNSAQIKNKNEQAMHKGSDQAQFSESINVNSNTPDKLKIKPQQMSNMNTRSSKDINMINNSGSNQQARDGQPYSKKQLLQKSSGENIQSSSESLMHQAQPNQSRSHSQQNLYSQNHIQLQAQNKIVMGKNNNPGVIINKQSSSNILHFQNGSSAHSNNSNSIKKLTSNAQLQNIYRPSNVNHSSGRSDAQVASQSRSKSSKQQFRGNKNISQGSNITTFNSIVTVKPNGQQQSHMSNNLDHQHFYQSTSHPSNANQAQGLQSSTNNRISIMPTQGQTNNSRNSILKIYNTVGAPHMQKNMQPTQPASSAQYASQKVITQHANSVNASAPIEQPQTVIRPISSSKNSRKALVGLEMPQVENQGEQVNDNSMQKRVLHQNLIYIGNQNMQKNALINQTASNQKLKKQDPINIQKIKVAPANDGQQQYQVQLSKYQFNNLCLSEPILPQSNQFDQAVGTRNLLVHQENQQASVPGFVEAIAACDSSSTGATGGTSTGAALQRRRSSNQREILQQESAQFAHSNSKQNILKMNHHQSINSNNSISKTKNRERNNLKKTDVHGKPLTATVNSQNQSLNNTQKIRQTSQKQTVASGGVIAASQMVSGPGTQSTKRSLSKKSQYAALGNAVGGPSPAPKTLAGKLQKVAHGGSSNERHQASSFRQIGTNKSQQSSSMTKSTSNLEQQQIQAIIRPNRTSSNPANRVASNKHRQVPTTIKSVPATASNSSDIKMTGAGAKHDVSNLNSLYTQQSALHTQKHSQKELPNQAPGQAAQSMTAQYHQQQQLTQYQSLLTSQSALAVPSGNDNIMHMQSQSFKQIPQLPNNASIKGSTVNSRLGMHNNN